MAKDTDKKPGVEQAPADKSPDKQTSSQVGPTPAQTTPAPEKADPSKVVSFEQVKTAAKEAPAKPGKADKAPARQGKAPKAKPERPDPAQAEKDAELEKQQKALLAEMDARADFHEQSKPRAPKQRADKAKAPAKAGKGKPAATKEALAEDGPTLAERKKQLEMELREKFGIPKSSKAVEPWVAPETETVVRIPHDQIHSFKDHPFNVDTTTAKFKAFVASIRAHGVTQPAIVRPREDGGFEMISGHRRDMGGIAADIPYTPCIVRALNDDQAIQQMVEDNVNNREISTMELARALNQQLNSLKHQGAQDALDSTELVSADDVGKRSNAVVAERNGMSVKQVQRHIALTNLVPALQEMVDGVTVGDKKALKISFTPAVELSAIKQKDLQEYIAVAIEGQQSAPSLEQAQRMKKLAEQGTLNPDVIDGILLEEKKEVANVILSSQELSQYFGKEVTPREMKDTILKLLDESMGQHKDMAKPEKKAEQEK